MENYKKVDINVYVKEGLNDGTLIPFKAEKFARIIAKQGTVGQVLTSWSTDNNGNPIIEKEDEIKLHPETNKPGWIATKANDNGEVIIDNNGNVNQWIIDDKTFNKKYEPDSINGLFKPTGGIQMFVKIPDNIILNQWGSDMKIAAGGFINITNIKDMYGISKRDFEDTYKKIDSNTIKRI